MNIDDTQIEDTYAEAFCMHYARIVVTAADRYWLDVALAEFTGYGASVIGCDVEAGIERYLPAEETPDSRPGAAVLLFGMSADKLAHSVPRRAGQCLMTCATTAAFDGLPNAESRIPLGQHIRFFGDGYQKSKVIAGRRYWRVPVFDGEFLVEATAGTAKGIGGGSMILQAISHEIALRAARLSVEALAELPGVITPFPGGVIRSGSKVGSRYRGVVASTNEQYCPTLRGRTETLLHPDAVCAYELVIDGIDEAAIAAAMVRSIRSAAIPGVLTIGAANYGGNLGKFHFRLHEVLQ